MVFLPSREFGGFERKRLEQDRQGEWAVCGGQRETIKMDN